MKFSKRYFAGLLFAMMLIISNCIIDENTSIRMAFGDFIYFLVYYTFGYLVNNLRINLKN